MIRLNTAEYKFILIVVFLNFNLLLLLYNFVEESILWPLSYKSIPWIYINLFASGVLRDQWRIQDWRRQTNIVQWRGGILRQVCGENSPVPVICSIIFALL